MNDNIFDFNDLIKVVTMDASSTQIFALALALIGLALVVAATAAMSFAGKGWVAAILLALGAWCGFYAYAVNAEFNEKKGDALTSVVKQIEKQTGFTPTDTVFAHQQVEALAADGKKDGNTKRIMGRYNGRPALVRLTMDKDGKVTAVVKEPKAKPKP